MHVILRTAPEGEPISQLADGSILLHARDVRIHVLLQYEPLALQKYRRLLGE